MTGFRVRWLHALGVLSLALGSWTLAILVALWAPSPLPAPERGVELGRVTLVEPGGARRGPVRVRIEGATIHSIGPARVEASDDLDGVFVLPGLTDAHAHLPMTGFAGDDAYTALLFLLHGVTQVRLAGGTDPEVLSVLRAQIAEGRLPGPRFYGCGPILDGPQPVIPGARSVHGPSEARAAVAELAARGVDCIKAYDRLDLATTAALRDAAHAHDLAIIGHTPQAVSFADAQLDDVQHLRGVHPPFADESLGYPHFLRAWLRLDEAWLGHVVEVSRRHGTAHTPTLVAAEGTVVSHDWQAWRRSPAMRLWLPHLRDGVWSGEVGFSPGRFATDEDVTMVRAANREMARTVRVLHEAGVPLHTGSDANAPNLVPGISLHRELALWVEAGLQPEEALEASTRRSAAFLGIEGAGSLEPGAPAELALFREDPTRDIAALSTLVAVVRDGRLYRREDLQMRIERHQGHWQGIAYRRVLMPTLRGALRALTGWLRRDAPER